MLSSKMPYMDLFKSRYHRLSGWIKSLLISTQEAEGEKLPISNK